MSKLRERFLMCVTCLLTIIGLVELHLLLLRATNEVEPSCKHVTGAVWVMDPIDSSRGYLCMDGRPVTISSCMQKSKSRSHLKNCLMHEKLINLTHDLNTKLLEDVLTADEMNSEQRQLQVSLIKDRIEDTRDLYDSMARPSDAMGFSGFTIKDVGSKQDTQQGVKYSDDGILNFSTKVSKVEIQKPEEHNESYDIRKALSKMSILSKVQQLKESLASRIKQNEVITELKTAGRSETGDTTLNNKPVGSSGWWKQKLLQTNLYRVSLDNGQTTSAYTLVKNGHLNTSVGGAGNSSNLPSGHPCLAVNTTIVAHPRLCHWYYNCSLLTTDLLWQTQELLTAECPYPQLFSNVTLRCMTYTEVNCENRVEYKAPCEYRENNCTLSTCHKCESLWASCVGLTDGVHPFPQREWSPWYVQCQDGRTMQQGKCPASDPIFSPESSQCVPTKSVAKMNGGTRNECQGRSDGYHPDETGVCHLFFECRSETYLGEISCPDDVTFDPNTWQCNSSAILPPCGPVAADVTTDIFCANVPDGFYADLYGRCSLYFECKQFRLRAFLKCPFGFYNPVKQSCDTGLEFYSPCGLRPNPCKGRPDGLFTDIMSNCLSSIICRNGYVSTVDPCPDGLVFDDDTKKCKLPEQAAPPCGIAPKCAGKTDGKHKNEAKGCAHYFTCSNQSLTGFGECDFSDGGFFFNPHTRECDFPQNICPPCGHSKKHSCYSNQHKAIEM